jgi:hypothetical protein
MRERTVAQITPASVGERKALNPHLSPDEACGQHSRKRDARDNPLTGDTTLTPPQREDFPERPKRGTGRFSAWLKKREHVESEAKTWCMLNHPG